MDPETLLVRKGPLVKTNSPRVYVISGGKEENSFTVHNQLEDGSWAPVSIRQAAKGTKSSGWSEGIFAGLCCSEVQEMAWRPHDGE